MNGSSRGRKELVDLLFRTQQEKWELVLIYHTLSGPERVSCQLKHFNHDCTLLNIMPASNSNYQAKNLAMGHGLVDCYVAQGPVIFRSRILRFNYDGSLEISFPEHYIFHERRSSIRFEMAQSPIVALSLPEKTLIKTCSDLGLGGFAVMFSISEKRNFPPKLELRENTMKFQSKKFFFDCEIVAELRPKPFLFEKFPYAFSRVSFRFVKLSDLDQQILQEILLPARAHFR